MIRILGPEQAVDKLNRSVGIDDNALKAVKQILEDVKERGDQAVFEYSKRFDGCELSEDTLRVSDQEFEYAYSQVSKELLEAMRHAAKRIRAFHEMQKQRSWFNCDHGEFLGQIVRPLRRVGIYVPGGRAAYPSSVLMNAIPASVAGVKEIIMVTPPSKTGAIPPLTLVAARESGVSEVIKVGGAQAVAALAYGTQTIAKVDKITGPGNQYVALAKREVYGQVGIDMIAGPSEVLIIADKHANPAYIAADMLAQAEHDPLAAAILITDCRELAAQTQEQIEKQLADLSREAIARASIENQSGIVVVKDLRKEGMEIANSIAPEHLELMVQDPFSWLDLVENAGAIFLGESSPEPLGDYLAGPNHVLPTNGTARFSSPLSVDDFIKKSSVINFSKEALNSVVKDIEIFARAEGLDAHAKSAAIRFELLS